MFLKKGYTHITLFVSVDHGCCLFLPQICDLSHINIFIPPTTPHHDNISTISDGFVVRLIHRDSALSPFYDPNLSVSDRAILAANRSIARPKYLNSLSSQSLVEDLSSKLIPEEFTYVMMYNVGTPPSLVYAIADICRKWHSVSTKHHLFSTPPNLPPTAQYHGMLQPVTRPGDMPAILMKKIVAIGYHMVVAVHQLKEQFQLMHLPLKTIGRIWLMLVTWCLAAQIIQLGLLKAMKLAL